jgi:hypothetical protein
VTIVVVAGMHRAGTSAMARGLSALGLDLGPRLMSADVRMNARGFFEDMDIVAQDDALLDAEGADWKSVALLDGVDWGSQRHEQARMSARELVASRVAPTGSFACKDPRMPRVLPFWQQVFAELRVPDAYVIAVRHPRAVVASLTARDALDPRRSAWLWLTHLACSLAYTQGRPRVVVDYDRLLEDPGRELARVARALDLPMLPANAPAMRAFRDEFLSLELRHAHFSSDDVGAGEDSPLVARAHALAKRLAADEIAPSSAEAGAAIERLFDEVRAFAPLLSYAGAVERSADQVPRLSGELAWARDAIAAAETYNANLRSLVAQRDQSAAAAKEYHEDLRANLTRVEGELAVAHRALERLSASLAGRILLRWLRRS